MEICTPFCQQSEADRRGAEILTACPVMRWDSLEARKETSGAISFGTATYPTAAAFESCAGIFIETAHREENQDGTHLFLKYSWGSTKTRLEIIPWVGIKTVTFGRGQRSIHIGLFTGPGA